LISIQLLTLAAYLEAEIGTNKITNKGMKVQAQAAGFNAK